MRVLAVNAGSSTLKLSLVEDGARTAERTIEAPGGEVDEERLYRGLEAVRGFEAERVVHRVVHGGAELSGAVPLDSETQARLRELSALAPLHQPKSLAAVDAVSEALPEVPAFACFDTAFHRDMPPEARTYAIPRHLAGVEGLRRYGFHGLSHAYASRRAAEMLGREAAGLRLVTCHLGSGASLCAVHSGFSVDTTMGFTPLEGLVMATRSGTVDPGLILWLLQNAEVDAEGLSHALEHESGLLALAGTADMRELEEREDEEAGAALAVYGHRLAAGIASMAAATGGMDAIVFTGGVGENSARVRGEAAARCAFLGLGVDREANRTAEPDCEITAEGAAVRALVIRAMEDVEMAWQVEGSHQSPVASRRPSPPPGD